MELIRMATGRSAPSRAITLILVVSWTLAAANFKPTEASLDSFLFKRQAEQEQTPTAKPTEATNNNNNNNNQPQQPPPTAPNDQRLYPDLPQHQQPPFNGAGRHQAGFYPHQQGPTPYLPFGLQPSLVPPVRLNADQQPAGPFGRTLPVARPTTAAERLQSQSFADGLGKRLLSMVGIGSSSSSAANQQGERSSEATATTAGTEQQQQQQQVDPTAALRNTTVLQQLNRGLQSIYGGLSRMYNSTVQEQLALLQERLRTETANSTNPWHQRMAQQVPQFFRQMTDRVGQAQDQLNRVWRDLGTTSTSTTTSGQANQTAASGQQAQSRSSSSGSFFDTPFIDRLSSDVNGMFQPVGGFFNQMGQSLGFGGAPAGPIDPTGQQQQQQQPPTLGGQIREFWATRVQPQVGMVRQQVARVWRELAASGAYRPADPAMMASRRRVGGGQQQANGSSSELLEGLMREVEMGNESQEYQLINSGNNNNNSDQEKPSNNGSLLARLSPQMQDRLIGTQRELNHLWLGLTNSLQAALTNVQRTLNPRQFGMAPPPPVSSQAAAVANANPADNEIDGKIQNLGKLQRDADMVYEAVQQQQRQTLTDRFRSFMDQFDLGGEMDQLPNRISNTVNRFGTVVGDLWNQIPERFDNFVHNFNRPTNQPDLMMARLQSTPSSSSSSSAAATMPTQAPKDN